MLDLFVPVYDGMYIINYIGEHIQSYEPILYVLSILCKERTRAILKECKTAGFYSVKPIELDAVRKNICRMLKNREHAQSKLGESNGKLEDDKFEGFGRHVTPRRRNLEWLIGDYLGKLGMGEVTFQAKCARAALEVALAIPKSIRFNAMELHDDAGQKFTPIMTGTSIERQIRIGVVKMKEKRTPLFELYFPDVETVRLTSTVFVRESVHALRRWVAENGNHSIYIGPDDVVYDMPEEGEEDESKQWPPKKKSEK